MLPLAVRPRQWSRKHFLIVLETASHLIGLDERLWACLPQHPDRDANECLFKGGPTLGRLGTTMNGPPPPPRSISTASQSRVPLFSYGNRRQIVPNIF